MSRPFLYTYEFELKHVEGAGYSQGMAPRGCNGTGQMPKTSLVSIMKFETLAMEMNNGPHGDNRWNIISRRCRVKKTLELHSQMTTKILLVHLQKKVGSYFPSSEQQKDLPPRQNQKKKARIKQALF